MAHAMRRTVLALLAIALITSVTGCGRGPEEAKKLPASAATPASAASPANVPNPASPANAASPANSTKPVKPAEPPAAGIAVAADYGFGASMALGSFLAGMVVGRSEFGLRAASEAMPMRDAFAVLFFVSVGMLFDPGQLVQRPVLAVTTR